MLLNVMPEWNRALPHSVADGEIPEIREDSCIGMVQTWYRHVESHVFADKTVHIGLLLPMVGRFDEGARIAGAAQLAVDRVNNDEALFPGYVLKFMWNNSGCSARQGLAALGKLMDRQRESAATSGGDSRLNIVIGPGCSSACEPAAYLAESKKIPLISWGCTSPALSNKEEYPLVCVMRTNLFNSPAQGLLWFLQFARTIAPDTSKGPALRAMCRHFQYLGLHLRLCFLACCLSLCLGLIISPHLGDSMAIV